VQEKALDQRRAKAEVEAEAEAEGVVVAASREVLGFDTV
jgi:hypothetical protein